MIITASKQITIGSDGLLKVTLTDLAGVAIDVDTYQFRIELYNDRVKARIYQEKELNDDGKYIISYDGETRVNNTIVDGVLYFLIDKYALKFGEVHYSQYETFESEDFGALTSACHGSLRLQISDKGCSSGSEEASLTVMGLAYQGMQGIQGEQGETGNTGAQGADGADGEDYILTEQDKTDIATEAAGLVDLSGYPTKEALEKYFETESIKVLDRIKIGAVTIYKTTKTDDDGIEVEAGYIYTDRGNIYTTKGNIYTTDGDIYSTEGDIYTVDGDFVARAGSFYKGSGDNKVEVAYKDELPTKTSELTNDSEFTTLAKVLEQVYSKSDTLTTTEIKALIAIVQGELDTLVGGDASTAIDSYNEIVAFLSSFSDSDDLASVLLALKIEIVALIPSLDGYMTTAIANETYVSLSGYVAYSAAEKTKLAGIAEGADVTPALGAVATSNSYNDLDDKPTIPTTDGLASESYVTTAITAAINDSWEGEY